MGSLSVSFEARRGLVGFVLQKSLLWGKGDANGSGDEFARPLTAPALEVGKISVEVVAMLFS